MKARSPMPTSNSSAKVWPDINGSETPDIKRSEPKPLVLSDLFTLADQPERLAWEFFRPGVEIHRLYGDGEQGPAAALLRYEPGAQVPPHTHTGYEHIIVLSGAQSDHHGTNAAGTLVINAPGSGHQVASKTGCIVLIIWEKPVAMQSAKDQHLVD